MYLVFVFIFIVTYCAIYYNKNYYVEEYIELIENEFITI